MSRTRVSIDGSGGGSAKSSGGKPSRAPAGPKDQKKIIMFSILGVALIGTILSVAWQMGVFGGPKAPPPEPSFLDTLDAKQQVQYKKELEIRDRALKKAGPPAGA